MSRCAHRQVGCGSVLLPMGSAPSGHLCSALLGLLSQQHAMFWCGMGAGVMCAPGIIGLVTKLLSTWEFLRDAALVRALRPPCSFHQGGEEGGVLCSHAVRNGPDALWQGGGGQIHMCVTWQALICSNVLESACRTHAVAGAVCMLLLLQQSVMGVG